MIQLTRFCGDWILVNSDLIEVVERTPDTVVTLVSGNRITVQETPQQIAERVRDFRRSLLWRGEEKAC